MTATPPKDPSKHPAAGLPEATKIDYLTMVAAMVYADRNVSPVELSRMRDFCRALDLSPEGERAVLAAAQVPDRAEVRRMLARVVDPVLKIALLTDAIVIVFADGKVHASEASELAEFARLLTMPAALASLIGKYVEQVVLAPGALPEAGTLLSRELAAGLGGSGPRSAGEISWLLGRLRGGGTGSGGAGGTGGNQPG